MRLFTATETREAASDYGAALRSFYENYDTYREDERLIVTAQVGNTTVRLAEQLLFIEPIKQEADTSFADAPVSQNLPYEPGSTSRTGTNFALQTLRSLLVAPVFLLGATVLVPIFTEDTEWLTKRTANAQPKAAVTVWLSKMLMATFSMLLLFLFAGGSFLAGRRSVRHGVRPLDLPGPVIDFTRDLQMHYAVLPLWQEAGRLLVLLTSFSLFAFGLFGLIALLFKGRILSFTEFALLILGFTRLFQIPPQEIQSLRAFPFWNPFTLVSVEAALADLRLPHIRFLLPGLVFGPLFAWLTAELESAGAVQQFLQRSAGKAPDRLLHRHEQGRGFLPLFRLELKKIFHQPAARPCFSCVSL